MTKDEYCSFAAKYVRDRMKKRFVNKLVFTPEELEKINEIDEFLKKIVCDNTDDILRALEVKYPRYICVDIKVSGKYVNDIFIHHFFDVEDFHYKKDSLYIAKAIFNIGKCRHCEVFYCTSLLRASKNNLGFMAPARKVDNAVSLSCLYVDLDLPPHLKGLSDEELLNRFEYDFYELSKYNGTTLIKSGGGIHMYILTETFDLKNENMCNRWKALNRSLAFLFKEWGSDLRCVGDKVRLLRIPNCINRKEKYGVSGAPVHFIKKDYRINTFEELEQSVDYALRGGNIGLFESIANEVMMIDDDSNDELFTAVSWDDDIFTGDYVDYVPASIFVEELDRLNELDTPAAEAPTITHTEGIITPEDAKHTGEYYNTYQGVISKYESIPAYLHFSIRDILFFISNRSSTVGIRHTTIYLCAYIMYFAQGIKNEEVLKKYCEEINRFFKPKYDEYEFNKNFATSLQTIKKIYAPARNMNSQVIVNYYLPTDEEKELTIGNYYEPGTTERKLKDNKRKAKNNARYRQKKRIKEGTITRDDKLKEREDYLFEHSDISAEDFCKMFNVSKGTFNDYKKRLFPDKNKQPTKEEQLFIDNPDISFEEFNAVTGKSRSSYHRIRRYIIS